MSESEKTIAYCHSCGAAMNVTAVAPFTNVACPKCGKHTRVKREFGPYTLLRRHAVGGMSMVFAAQDNTLDREVALKILSEDYSADERRIDAFVEEARLTASFSHPHVVQVLKTGRAFGRFFIAMEFVPGGHFEARIRKLGKVPELEMLPLAIEVAEGLKAAHAAGLIHRDVKPGNILLDSEGHAKLVDFGLALVTQGGKAQAKELWATPYYVPPETVEGQEEDFRSDVYAFGATVYHALAGKPPCDEQSMATDKLREAKKAVRPLGEVEETISEATCRIIDKAMAYDPKDRFGSYDELIRELGESLQRLKAGTSESNASAKRRRAGLKRRERNRRLALVAGVALVAGGIVWISTRKDDGEVADGDPVVEVPELVEVEEPLDPEVSASIVQGYRAARSALEARDFRAAEKAFEALHVNPLVHEPTRTWAGVEAVMACYLDGSTERGRKLAAGVLKHVRGLAAGESEVGGGVLAALEQLDGFTPMKVAAPAGERATPEWLATAMLSGLKNWQQGFLEAGGECFSMIAKVRVEEQDEWGAIYQDLAGEFLEDLEVLSGPLFAGAPATAEACREAAYDLNSVRVGLKTRGRARFNVRAWQLDLVRQAKLLREADEAAARKQAEGAPGDGAGGGEVPAIGVVLAELEGYADACDFAGAVDYLMSLDGDPEGAELESLWTVAGLARDFLTDINADLTREHVTDDLELKSGEVVKEVWMDPATGGLVARDEVGDRVECGWADFTAGSLIQLHRVLVKKVAVEDERTRRHQCAIAFQWLAGERVRAQAAAAVLAESNESFRKSWEKVAGGLPD
ncbi:MAG: serine/threonine protein kinase [Verrucomicrobiota bacterium JB025]|nr:serine/threonine-protein kinase [Verrucomicrobiota bacterium JB025]